MQRDQNPDRLDDGARADAEMKERETPTQAICKTCGEAFDLSGEHKCPGLLPLPAPQGDDGLVGRFQMKSEHDWVTARPDTQGDWVRYSDYAAQAAEIAGLKAERGMISEHVRKLIPAGQSLSQADSVYGVIGCIVSLAEQVEAAESRLTSAMEALTEAEETLRLSEHPAFRDPQYGDEVEALGDRIGYGALMSSASASWRKRLAEDGDPVGGEFVAGPCHVTVVRTLGSIRATLSRLKQGEKGGE